MIRLATIDYDVEDVLDWCIDGDAKTLRQELVDTAMGYFTDSCGAGLTDEQIDHCSVHVDGQQFYVHAWGHDGDWS